MHTTIIDQPTFPNRPISDPTQTKTITPSYEIFIAKKTVLFFQSPHPGRFPIAWSDNNYENKKIENKLLEDTK